MTWEYVTSDAGMKFIAFIAGGVLIAAVGVWKVVQHFSKSISAKDSSIAAGRDVNISTHHDKDSKGK